MKKNFFKSTLGMAVLTAAVTFTVISCNKKDDVVPNTNKATVSKANQRVVECEECVDTPSPTNFNGQSLPAANVGNPANWTAVYNYNLPAGSVSTTSTTGAQLQFGNFFDSFVSGVNGWKVGYLDNLAYSTALSTIDCEVLDNYGVIDDNNYLGMDDSDSTPVNYGEGWYHYNNVSRTIVPFRIIFAWLDCDNNGCITSGDKVYVIKLNVTPNFAPPSSLYPYVVLDYKCVDVSCDTDICNP